MRDLKTAFLPRSYQELPIVHNVDQEGKNDAVDYRSIKLMTVTYIGDSDSWSF